MSHGGEVLNDTMGIDDEYGAKGGGALGADSAQMEPGDTAGPGGHNEAAATTIRGGIGVPES